MNNAIVINTADMPLASAARERRTHSWENVSIPLTATAYEAAGNLHLAAAFPAFAPARAHRLAVPVRHRQLS